MDAPAHSPVAPWNGTWAESVAYCLRPLFVDPMSHITEDTR